MAVALDRVGEVQVAGKLAVAVGVVVAQTVGVAE